MHPVVGLILTSSIYAALLWTKPGRRFANNFTWLSVVIGVLLVWFWLWVAYPAYVPTDVILQYFAAGGAPIIVREFALLVEKYNDVVNHERDQ